MSAISTLPLFAMPPFPIRRFSVAEYHRMIDAGILTEDDPVELLEGWIAPKMPRTALHDGIIQKANKRVGRRLPVGWDIRGQSAITTTDSEPEPDLAVVRGNETAYLYRKPEPPDIGVLIEVSDSTLSQDRNQKGRLYARAGVPYYWIINLADGWVEVYTDPDSAAATPSYRTRTDCQLRDQVPLILDGQTVAMVPVTDLLP